MAGFYSGAAAPSRRFTGPSIAPVVTISFDVGSKRAVSYFLSDNGQCKLVLTLADPPKWDDISTFTATRFEARVPGGKATRFLSSESKSYEFACHVNAQAMRRHSRNPSRLRCACRIG